MKLPLRTLALAASATLLQAWGPGTHIYVGNQLKEVGTNKAELMYGGLQVSTSTFPCTPHASGVPLPSHLLTRYGYDTSL